MVKDIKIEKEKIIRVKPKMIRKSMGEVAEKPYYLKDMPNQTLHKVVSFIKSGVRILACIIGATVSIPNGFIILGVAEVIGIIEEMV
jgi:hypothetical protein